MLQLLMERYDATPEKTLVVSDMPRDQTAAQLLGCLLTLPGVFERQFHLTDGFQRLVKG